MKKLTRFLALATALCMLGVSAIAESPEVSPSEDAQVQSEAVAEEEAQEEDVVLVTVNGEDITQADVDAYAYQLMYYFYQHGYDVTNESIASQIRSLALQGCIQQAVFYQKAHELGFDQFTEEEEAKLTTDAQEQLDAQIENYISNNITLAEDATDEDKAAAREQAIAALEEQGYTLEAYLEYDRNSEIYDRLYEDIVKDAAVTDEETKAAFDEQVESDKTTYADVSYYEMAKYYYGQTPYYTPEGYRGVTHILLSVDDDVLKNYQDLQAALEEQEEETDADTENTDDTATDTDLDTTPVTQADVDAAYAAVIASVQPTIDEINEKLAAGTPFAKLVEEYGTDPGMNQEPTKSEGYSVHMDSIRYDPAFVKAAFSVDNIGDVSEPYVGSYGVYIVCYVRDVPAGPVEFTDELKSTIASELLSNKQQSLYNEAMDAWEEAAEVTYTAEGEVYKSGVPAGNDTAADDTAADDAGDTASAE